MIRKLGQEFLFCFVSNPVWKSFYIESSCMNCNELLLRQRIRYIVAGAAEQNWHLIHTWTSPMRPHTINSIQTATNDNDKRTNARGIHSVLEVIASIGFYYSRARVLRHFTTPSYFSLGNGTPTSGCTGPSQRLSTHPRDSPQIPLMKFVHCESASKS
jgi:hypothetical protein